MIVSHKHKLILVRPVKVAGTSLQKILAEACGPDDVISQTVDKEGGIVVPSQNMPAELEKDGPHAEPPRIRAFFPKEWEEYTKVTIVRNPWDLLVSLYYFAHGRMWKEVNPPTYFSEFVRWHIAGSYSNNKIWFDEGAPFADVTLKYETINEDCEALFNNFSIPFPGLPYLNRSVRPDRVPYGVMYDLHTLELLADAYHLLITIHGYKFEHPCAHEGRTKRFHLRQWLESQGLPPLRHD